MNLPTAPFLYQFANRFEQVGKALLRMQPAGCDDLKGTGTFYFLRWKRFGHQTVDSLNVEKVMECRDLF